MECDEWTCTHCQYKQQYGLYPSFKKCARCARKWCPQCALPYHEKESCAYVAYQRMGIFTCRDATRLILDCLPWRDRLSLISAAKWIREIYMEHVGKRCSVNLTLPGWMTFIKQGMLPQMNPSLRQSFHLQIQEWIPGYRLTDHPSFLPVITYLSLSSNEPLDGLLHLLTSLRELRFTGKFSQPLHNQLPTSLELLEFNKDYDQPLPDMRHLTELKHLWFSDRFNHPVENLLPRSIKYLRLGKSFNRPLDDNVLPESLEQLHFATDSEFQWATLALPPKTALVMFGRGARFKGNLVSLPKGCKVIKL